MQICRICGKEDCREHILKIPNIKKMQFTGSSPPEIFVGRYNYPNVYVGVLSPEEKGDTKMLSSQELWHQKRLTIPEITNLRSKLIYGRRRFNIKKSAHENNFLKTMQEVAMTSRSIATEFKLKKAIEINTENENHIPIIRNAANARSIRLEENPKIERKIDYITNDTNIRATTAILELEKTTPTSTIIKILSAGLLGLGSKRKLVPTRWSITAVDDTLSKENLKKIKDFQEIQEVMVFYSEYLGNHYEFLLLPENFSFEVIEINQSNPKLCWQDSEGFFGRKNYASNVTGAYYANRLALTEYLKKIRRQCSCLALREISEEYTQSMGVGILRQISREAFSNPPEVFQTIREALERIQTRIKLPISDFTSKSEIIKNYGKQKKLDLWLN